MSKHHKPPLFDPNEEVIAVNSFALDDVLDRVADRLIQTMKQKEEKSAKKPKSKKKRRLD